MISRYCRSRSPLTRVMPPEMTCRAVFFPPRSGTVLMRFTPDDDFYDEADTANLPDCAAALLARAGSWSARKLKNGFVPSTMLAGFSSDPDQAVAELCRRGIWKRAKGGYRFANWSRWSETAEEAGRRQADAEKRREPVVDERILRQRAADARRQALFRDPALKQAIRERDADTCRYCGVGVRWGKGRAPDTGTYDHVDPEGPNTLENLVVACCSCNSAKRRRTPAAAGMKVLDPPCPKPRNASRNASDLRNGKSEQDRNSSSKGYGHRYLDRSKSDQDLDQSLSRKQPVLDARARKAKPGTPEFRRHVIAKFLAVTGESIDVATADALASDVLADRKGVGSALAYVFAAIDREADPPGRWLPQPAEPEPLEEAAEHDWCGLCCHRDDRNLYDEQNRLIGPCPRCSTVSAPAWERPPRKAKAS